MPFMGSKLRIARGRSRMPDAKFEEFNAELGNKPLTPQIYFQASNSKVHTDNTRRHLDLGRRAGLKLTSSSHQSLIDRTVLRVSFFDQVVEFVRQFAQALAQIVFHR
jgi:hypothetical protein